MLGTDFTVISKTCSLSLWERVRERAATRPPV
jgi:hypothetical protein